MKRCFACGSQFSSALQSCINCQRGPAVIDGVDCYAPALAYSGGGFKANYFSDLAGLEETNFWFQSRNRLIVWAIEKYASNFCSMLEIGCGTAYVLSGIAKKFPNAVLSGSEIFLAGLSFASARLPTARFMQMDARAIPFNKEFDVIGAFDVIEHIKDDVQVLSEIHAALKPGGMMLLTVPQHPWLWSSVDQYACHERRYTAVDLHEKVKNAGFHIVRSTSFMCLLLPAMVTSRWFKKNTKVESLDATAELRISPLINDVFFKVLRFELNIIKSGINLSMGGSRFVVAQKI